MARVRLFHTEHPVVQSHPETELGDLRLTAPFPELADYAACPPRRHPREHLRWKAWGKCADRLSQNPEHPLQNIRYMKN